MGVPCSDLGTRSGENLDLVQVEVQAMLHMSRAPVSRAAKPAQRDSVRYGAREEGRVESTGSRV